MHIISLSLKQFGRHAEINANLDGPVIGIIGPNGSGKSTVLQAIRFALTGFLEDDRESYVRNWDPNNKEAPTNGSVRLEFEKDGQRGVIFRQLGKSPRQSLEWDGKTVKAVKDIDTILADVLGADRQALDHAVFIPQGSFDKLLFGSNTEREQLYARLFLVSFCERLSSLCTDKAKGLVATLRDLTSLSDEVNAQVREGTKVLMELDQTVRLTPAPSKEAVQAFQAYRNLVNEYASKGRERWPLIDEIKTATSLVEQATQNLANAGCASPAEADAKMSEIADQLSKGESRAATHEARGRAAKRLENTKTALTAAQHKLQTAINEVVAHQKNEMTTEAKAQNRLQAAGIRQLQSAVFNLPILEKGKAAEEQRIQAATTEHTALEQKSTTLYTEGTSLGTQLAPLKLALELVDKVQKTSPTAHAHEGTTCPVCQSRIDAHLLSAARVTELRSLIAPLEARLVAARQEYATTQKQSADLASKLGGYRQALLTAARAIEDANKIIKDPALAGFALSTEDDAKKLEAQANLADETTQFHLPAARKAQVAASLAFQNATADKASAEAELATATANAPTDYDPAAWVTQQEELKTRKSLLSTLRANKVAADTSFSSAEKNKAQVERRLQELNGEMGTAYASAISHALIADLFRMLESDPEGSPQTADTACARVAELLGDYQTKAQDAISRFEQQKVTMNSLDVRKKGIDIGMQENEKQRELADQMKAMAQLFSRDGLPMAYMRSRFSEIAELTSQYLAELDSSFIIRPQSAKAVTFEFMRIDEGGTDCWMDQKKLSGGQRVRLTVAFLLAVQRAVLPDVGLLVLDEPTMHLDDPGKESLSQLLQSLAGTFTSGEAQILVCDHAPEIKDGLTHFIALQ